MKSMRFRQPAAPRLAWLTRVARTLVVLVGTLVAGAQPAAFARSGAVATAEEVADLAPLMPRPAGAGDEPLAAIAPKLVLAIAAERVQLQPAAAVAARGKGCRSR